MSWQEDTAARTLAQEARGEPEAGQLAVAWVIRNRVMDGRWGNNLASVCLWRAQFSGWYDPKDPNFAYATGLPDDNHTLQEMLGIIQTVMDADTATDLTGGALFYYAASMTAPPDWAETMTPCGKFGNQLFFTDRGSV
jgi:spore germination cell wall hydrolase CwlJ-like protein